MIVVASTIGPWKAGQPEEGDIAWLRRAEAMAQFSPEPLTFFCAIETDHRYLEPYDRLLARQVDLRDGAGLEMVNWFFEINDNSKEIESGNRLVRICTGRNLAHEFAMRNGASHILFLDTDIEVQDDQCLGKLLALDHPVVGGNVPAYCMSGPPVEGDWPEGAVQEHWNTAGFLLVCREVFRKIRWRYDLDAGMTDDPCFQFDQQQWGFGKTWVRHDVIGAHVEPLIAVEERPADKTLHYD